MVVEMSAPRHPITDEPSGPRSIGPSTWFRADLKTTVAICVAIAGIVWAARGNYAELSAVDKALAGTSGELRRDLEVTKVRIEALASKDDLRVLEANMRRAIAEELAKQPGGPCRR